MARRQDVREVGFFMHGQRCRHTQNHDVTVRDPREVCADGEVFIFHERSYVLSIDVLNERLTAPQDLNLAFIDVKSSDLESLLKETNRERNPNVSKTNNADNGLFAINSR